jgi:hypothetical protein
VSEGQSLDGLNITLTNTETYCARVLPLDSKQGVARFTVSVTTGAFFGGLTLLSNVPVQGDMFNICGLSAGTYSVLAGAGSPGNDSRYAVSGLTIADRSTRLNGLALEPLKPLRGSLSVADGAAPKPLPQAVSISLDGLSYLEGVGHPSISDERTSVGARAFGEFEIPAVLAASYWLNIRTPPGFYVKSASASGTDAMREPISGAVNDLRIVLGQDAAQLSVRVADPAGMSVANAVVLVGRDPLPARNSPGDTAAVYTDFSGSGTIGGLAPGRYRIVVLKDATVQQSTLRSLFESNSGKSERVDLAPGEDRSMTITLRDR